MFDIEWYAFVIEVMKFRAKMDNNANIRRLRHNLRFSISSEDIVAWCKEHNIDTTQLTLVVIYVSMLKMYFNIHNKTDIDMTRCLGKHFQK